MNRIYLYTTEACTLCEEAGDMLLPLAHEAGLILDYVEISDSDQLVEDYGLRIPVVGREGVEEELGWPFSREQLSAFIKTTQAMLA